MDPANIQFNALIVGPTNSGKTQFLVNQLCGPYCSEFDYVVLICPTFAYNKTLYRFAERDRGENVAAIVLFYTPLAKTMKTIFEEYAGELSHDELKKIFASVKDQKFAHLVF